MSEHNLAIQHDRVASTLVSHLPEKLPAHIAIVMDGNGRWANQRHMPRIAGHHAGMMAARKIVTTCVNWGIPALTLFAFSSENWERPPSEVNYLMDLLQTTLEKEVEKLHQNNVCLHFIGDRKQLNQDLQHCLEAAETLTQANTGLRLTIAINYGGRWDITQACQQIATQVAQGTLLASEINQALVDKHMCLSHLPTPDLFIRTSGELRISNFLIWQLAYTELYFTDAKWPDFDESELMSALQAFAARQRRYGGLN